MATSSIALYVGLSSTQADTWQTTGILRAQWFGGSIPLKPNVLAAREAYQEHYGAEELPPYVAKVTINSDWFLTLVNEGKLQVCHWVDGYRFKTDISMQDVLAFCRCEVFLSA